MSRSAEQLYQAAIDKCKRVSMDEGDHTFEVSEHELYVLQQVPYRSNIGNAMCRNITGKPERFCGLIVTVK